MKRAECQIADFHIATGTPVVSKPAFPSQDRIDLRYRLIEEEWKEYQEAVAARDIVETADAIGDMIVVLIGTALEFGIPLYEVWEEIHRSNMAKVDPATGTVVRRADGKILKPDGWTPPNIAAVLGVS